MGFSKPWRLSSVEVDTSAWVRVVGREPTEELLWAFGARFGPAPKRHWNETEVWHPLMHTRAFEQYMDEAEGQLIEHDPKMAEAYVTIIQKIYYGDFIRMATLEAHRLNQLLIRVAVPEGLQWRQYIGKQYGD